MYGVLSGESLLRWGTVMGELSLAKISALWPDVGSPQIGGGWLSRNINDLIM